jgi:hypothetical protein
LDKDGDRQRRHQQALVKCGLVMDESFARVEYLLPIG